MSLIYDVILFLGSLGIISILAYSPIFYLLIGAGVGLLIGLILGGIGIFGYYQTYNLSWGLVGILIQLAFWWALFLFAVHQIPLLPSLWMPPPPFPLTYDLLVSVLNYTFIVVSPLLWSIVVVQAVPFTGKKRSTLLAGILLIVTGFYYFLYYIINDFFLLSSALIILLSSTAMMLLSLTCLVNAVVFLTADTTKL
jgi:hypothetical protein